MDTTPTPSYAKLAKKILAIMAEIGPLKKDKKNDFHKYQYASEELIMGAIRDLCIKHGVGIFPSEKSCSTIVVGDSSITQIEMEFLIVDADSNETKSSTFFGHGIDKGDKGVYKAGTGAEKYFLMKQFMIAAEDDPEFEKNQAAARRTFQEKSAAQKPGATAARPATATASSSGAAPVTSKPTQGGAALPTATTPFPPPAPGKTRGILRAFVEEVSRATSKQGNVYFKIKGTEGETYTTFSETVARHASEVAKTGLQIDLAIDSDNKGALAVGVRPA